MSNSSSKKIDGQSRARGAKENELAKTTVLRSVEKKAGAVRSLGSLENLFWLFDQISPIHFATIALVTGEATFAEWRNALDQVQKRHPLLRVCIKGKPGSIPYFSSVDEVPIPLRLVPGDPGALWEEEVADELSNPFNPEQGPLVRAVLIHGDRCAAFILTAHHSIADGISMAIVMRDALEALGGAALSQLPLPPSQEESFGLSVAESVYGLDDPPEPADSGGMTESISSHHHELRLKVRSLQLSAGLSTTLRNRARQEGASVHGALCAALVAASRGSAVDWKREPMRIFSPVEMKTVLNRGEHCGLCMGAEITHFKAGEEDFWTLARQAKAAVGDAKTRENLEKATAGLHQVVSKGIGFAEAAELHCEMLPHDAVITNLGALPFEPRYGKLDLTALWAPVVGSLQSLTQTFGALSLNGALYLTHTSREPVEGLLEAIEKILTQACSTGRDETSAARDICEGAD